MPQRLPRLYARMSPELRTQVTLGLGFSVRIATGAVGETGTMEGY